jgi:hypothetical protein
MSRRKFAIREFDQARKRAVFADLDETSLTGGIKLNGPHPAQERRVLKGKMAEHHHVDRRFRRRASCLQWHFELCNQ